MLKKHGKWFARWMGADGKRHSKACETRAAAKQLQEKEAAKRERKKARPTPA